MQKSGNKITGTPNRNGRIYPKETFQQAIEDYTNKLEGVIRVLERNEKKKARKDKLLRLNEISNKKESNSNGEKSQDIQ